jgi:transposase
MHIVCLKNHGIDYLQVQESYSIKVNGVLKNRNRVVRNIGPLSRFDDGKPDYLKRLRQSFKDGLPLIAELSGLPKNKSAPQKIIISFNLQNKTSCFTRLKNIGYFLLDGLYKALCLDEVLNSFKYKTKLKYDLNGLSRLLVFGRLLCPDSKIQTWNGRNGYAFNVASSEETVEIYRTLDCLDEAAWAIQKRMNTRIAEGVGRNMEVCFYDVTNYYFQINENDADELDDCGNVIRQGLRKKGMSKEKQRTPIVQMGLFMDDDGLPVSYHLFPGNKNDQTTLRPALEKNMNIAQFGRVIIVADGGLNCDKNVAHILKSGNGYILSKSVKKSDKAVKRWMTGEDYTWDEKHTFKTKSQIRERVIDDGHGVKMTVKEKLVCFWSKKHYDKELHEYDEFVGRLEDVIADPKKLNEASRNIEKFLKKKTVDVSNGTQVQIRTELSLDVEKLQDMRTLLGYYTIFTSETAKPDEEIIRKYRGLSRIEDSFRITKSELRGRPVYVRKPEHINAHFLLCFIALTMVRLIQYKVLKYQGKDMLNLEGWESGITAERIQEGLANYTSQEIPGGYCLLSEPNDDLKLILDAFGIDSDLRLPTISDLRQYKYSFDKATLM